MVTINMNSDFKIPLLEDEINEIKDLIEKRDHCKITISKSFTTLWFIGDNNETELRLNFLPPVRLTVSRVCFHNRRQGIMEDVLNLLEKYCKNYGIPKLCIQSVLTKEMDNFCRKWNIQPDPYASIPMEDFISGDHVKEIENEVYDDR